MAMAAQSGLHTRPYKGKPCMIAAIVAGNRYLIVDEASMASAQQLMYIERRLKEVFSQSEAPFGGLSVITEGDFC